MLSRGRLKRAAGAGLGATVVVALVLVALAATGVLAAPTVGGVESQWGTVTDETTTIETTATVRNPNPVGVPGVVDVRYAARLNDVVLARGEKRGVGFGPGENRVRLSTEMPNERMADWWVTHVNGGERSTLSVRATVTAPGFERTIPAASSTIETDLLGGFATGGERAVEFRGDPFLVVRNQTATWGAANESVTPLSVRSTVENRHDYEVTLDGVAYTVEMNGVTLADDRQLSGVSVAPDETGRLDVEMALDSAKMADWWAAHVRDDEKSTITVELYGLVERDSAYERVPLRLYERSLSLETDVLGANGTTVTARDSPERAASFSTPTVRDTTREWGAVTDATTAIHTAIAVDNSNGGPISDLLALDIAQRTAINGVPVAAGETRVDQVGSGSERIDFTTTMNNSKVPAWWARHVNRGERSTVTTVPSVRADLGFSRFDVPVANRTSEFETDLLAGLRDAESETVTVDGRRALVVQPRSVAWGRATPETAPILVNATLENEQRAAVEVTEIRYRVALNGVVLANSTTSESYSVEPGETTPVGFTMALDNERMDQWWVTHVRNGESTDVSVRVTATVETRTGTETVRLDSLSTNGTARTDVFGEG